MMVADENGEGYATAYAIAISLCGWVLIFLAARQAAIRKNRDKDAWMGLTALVPPLLLVLEFLPKRPPLEGKGSTRHYWLLEAVGVTFCLLLMAGSILKAGSGNVVDQKANGLAPRCDSKLSRDEVTETLEDNNVKVLDLFGFSEVHYEQTADVRFCQATAVLSSRDQSWNGRQRIAFRFFPKSDRSNYIVEVKPFVQVFGNYYENPWFLSGEIKR